ncbi:restriction endonuclease subunit S [bacterium]|nr:restriction endonuclease subunit S [bacterium]
MQSKPRIKDITEVIAGYTFRTAIQNDADGAMHVVQAKDILHDNRVNWQGLPKVTIENLRSSATLEQNDVLLSCRGAFRAGVLTEKLENAIASASLYILRVKNETVQPEYLSIYLNSNAGQRQIQQILSGTIIKTILRRELENLPVIIPSLQKQKQVIAIYENWKKREELLNRKITLNNNIANGAINYLLTQ